MRRWFPPPSGPGSEHFLAWWAVPWFAVCAAVGVGVLGVFLYVAAWLFSLGLWFIAIPWALVSLYAAYEGVGLVGPVVVRERGFWVRIVTHWVEIPWDNVDRMQYLRGFPFHVVYLRRAPRGPRLLPRAFWWPTMGAAAVLPLGLRRRRELFWTIWWRASRARGYELPVRGYLGDLRPPPRDDVVRISG
jgi:hypothetical protein